MGFPCQVPIRPGTVGKRDSEGDKGVSYRISLLSLGDPPNHSILPFQHLSTRKPYCSPLSNLIHIVIDILETTANILKSDFTRKSRKKCMFFLKKKIRRSDSINPGFNWREPGRVPQRLDAD